MSFWLEVLIGIPLVLLNFWIGVQLHHFNNRRLQKQFLRHARIEHPEATVILSAMETSDYKALKNLKEKLDALPPASTEG